MTPTSYALLAAASASTVVAAVFFALSYWSARYEARNLRRDYAQRAWFAAEQIFRVRRNIVSEDMQDDLQLAADVLLGRLGPDGLPAEVANKTLTQPRADKQVAALKAVLQTLENLNGKA